MSEDKREISIHVPVLARVEGEGALDLYIQDGRIEDLKLRIYEPPRFFEGFVQGRLYSDLPDMVARICGICPVAYQMSAVQAAERAFGIDPGPWVRAMRRVFYCGEWLQSHALHIHLLAAPDFLGYDNAMAMAAEYPGEVRRGLRLQGLGNRLIGLFGARSVHPVGARVGGFHHAPSMEQADELLNQLRAAQDDAEALVRWTASLDLPEDGRLLTSVALRHPRRYPMYEGRLISSNGLDIDIDEYEQHFEEHQVPHSTALHSHLNGEPYLVGPLARLNLNYDRLPEPVAETLADIGISFPSTNVFHSIVARAVEIQLAIVEAIRILERYEPPQRPFVDVAPRKAVGVGCSEAPRGILWHRYAFDGEGRIQQARIVPPTSQNQAHIEQDLHRSLEHYGLDHSDEELRHWGETVIRNYDPCISCATHFLNLRVFRQ